MLFNNDVFSSVPPNIKEAFLTSKLNQPLLQQFSLTKQREDQSWVQEMNTTRKRAQPALHFPDLYYN